VMLTVSLPLLELSNGLEIKTGLSQLHGDPTTMADKLLATSRRETDWHSPPWEELVTKCHSTREQRATTSSSTGSTISPSEPRDKLKNS
jgi:hypothetical protein